MEAGMAGRRAAQRGLAAILASVALTACQQRPAPAELVRPVRTTVVGQATGLADLTFPGEVRPEIESRLGFRVGGKLVERRVELGERVRRGQVLARLDPQDLRLGEAAARAQLDSAAANRTLAEADYRRFDDLYKQNYIAKAELDRRRTTMESAAAAYASAEANLRNQANQTAYAQLVADADGVVTGVEAEPGQVVSAGQPIVRVARTRGKEVVIAVPEDRVDAIRTLRSAGVRIWALPGRTFDAEVRDVAAAADPATRTYTIKLGLVGDSDAVRIGMTAVAAFATPTPTGALRLPLSALVERGGVTGVWTVDPKQLVATFTPVQVAGPAGNDVLVASGLAAGQRVVTAGANLLQAGQRVKLLEESTLSVTPAPATTGAPK